MSVVNYKKLLAKTGKLSGVDVSVVEPVCAALIEAIIQEAMKGHTVQIENFGMFRLKFLHKRVMQTHPVSGEEAVSEEHIKLSFKEYTPLKQRISKAKIF